MWPWSAASCRTRSIAARDIDRLLFAVVARNAHGLGGTRYHIGLVAGRDDRWIPVRPVPGNVEGLRVADVARQRLCQRRFAEGWAVRIVVGPCGPETVVEIVVVPEIPMQEVVVSGDRMPPGNAAVGHAS